ncbi:hypothetical protein PR202_gb18274 [Eleusine coracana subsp. coracana]|uniref:Fe2OG dioxygenase domain-containing protein n=1 Tax=Eleusine coracana subsp. coracana TaxID=191504 RepID=A0AAV5F4G7_ELECO|nr:hypothetical protein QOZ80_3BG0297690 [Eleusine coracana subsp. coracana]GJN30002.1 hypothetical protein PR202_gb18274 [Eleusine coracana subsp. coracana]
MESLPVPSVQALVAATGGADVPPRYLRPEAAADAAAGDDEAEIPIIDFQRLLMDSHEEAARLHGACQEWGFFQLINHGIPHDVVEGMKAGVEGFFQQPAETKKQFAQERGQLDGYGQLFVVSEDQKLDWADILFLNTQPPQDRNMRFWPDKPANLRRTLDKYSAAVKEVADGLLGVMSKNLGLEPGVIAEKCVGGIQAIRMNYYPPCAEAHKVVGFAPHSDSDLLTLVLQVNEVQGLQIRGREDGSWVPVKPVEGSLVVNVGDIFEIFTNGRYRSIEHRAMINTEKERLSVAAFHSPSVHATIGPLREVMAHGEEVLYKTVDHERSMRLFFSAKLEGKSFLQRMKLT